MKVEERFEESILGMAIKEEQQRFEESIPIGILKGYGYLQ